MAALKKNVMKGIRCTAIGDPLKSISIEHDIPIPSIANKHEVLVKIHYTAINPIDWKQINGQLGFIGKKPPFIPGGDFSGRVVAIGEAVQNVKIGDLVYGVATAGSMAEYTVVKHERIGKIPSNITLLQAAAAPLVSITSYQALQVAGLNKGDSLLILGGTTACGLAAIQIAKNHIGCSNVTVTSTQETLCKSLGADMVINYQKEEWKSILQNKGFDVVYDCVGGVQSWEDVRSHNVIKKDGFYITITGDKLHGDTVNVKTVVGNAASIVNRKFWGAVGNQKYEMFLANMSKNINDITALVESGKLKVMLAEESPFEFNDFLKLFAISISHKARGKLVLTICDDADVNVEEKKEDVVVEQKENNEDLGNDVEQPHKAVVDADKEETDLEHNSKEVIEDK